MKITRTTQPQTPAGIDWSNPITKGLVSLVNPSIGGDILSKDIKFTFGPNTRIAAAMDGISITQPVARSGYYGPRGAFGKANVSGFPLSIFVCAKLGGNISENGLIFGVGDGANGGFSIGKDYNYCLARWKTNSQTGAISGYATSKYWDNTGLVHGFVLSDTCKIYSGGKNIVSRGAPSGSLIYDNTYGHLNIFGNLEDNIPGSTGNVYWGGVWNRALSDAEIRSLSANPWQIFQPIEKKVFIGTSVAVEGQIYNLDYTDLSYLVDLPDTEVATSLDIVEPSSTAETVYNALQFNSDSTDPQSSTDTTSSILETVVDATDNLVYTDSLELNITVQIAQTLIPIGEISNTGWTGTYADIDDETTTEYITTNTIGSIAEYNLTSGLDPYSNIGHLPSIMLSADAGGIIIRLKQGATVIKSWTYNTLPSTPTLYSPTLTTTEVDSITDYTDLRYSFESIY